MEADADDLARVRARLGTVLSGKYRLDRVLGIGGMATVFAATHLRNANRVAVKVLHRELSVDAGLRARFLREGKAGNSVEHAGTVRVLDDDVEPDGTVFLVMELLVGETLERRWERSGRRLGVAEVVAIATDVLDVLTAAHAKGIVHRDLKPENLFVTRDKGLRVLDFGVARLRESSPTKTKSGAVFGTPAFMPPEQALGRTKDVDALSDVWAVGATAFTLLSGRYVHSGETAEEMLVQAATQPAPRLLDVEASVPATVATVIDRALAFDRRDRWQSAADMSVALRAALDNATAETDGTAWDDEKDRTRVAAPPAMTLRPGPATLPSSSGSTVLLPTLPPASTIAGLSTTGAKRKAYRRTTRALVGAVATSASALVVVVLLVIFETLGPGETTRLVAVSNVGPLLSEVARAIDATEVDRTPSPSSTVVLPVDAPTAAPPVLAPASSRPSVDPVPPAASRPAPGLPANPNCSPPYEVVDGIRRWKKACL
jgi:eukaryotic-like serine/threonine-protein kinase